MRTYTRYATRLRFEVGQSIPAVGDAWLAETVFGHRRVKVRLLAIKRTFEHPNESGVTLMDARISRSDFGEGGACDDTD